MRKKLLIAIALLVSGVGNLWAGIHYTLEGVPSVTYSSKGVTSLTSGNTYVLYNAGTSKFLYIDDTDKKTPKLSETKVSAFKLESTSSQYYLHNENGKLAKDASSDWNTWANGSYGDEAKWYATLSSGKYKLRNYKKASDKYFGGGSGAGEGSQCYCDKGINVEWYLIDLSNHTLAVSLLFQLNKAFDEYYEKATVGDAKTALGTALDDVYATYVKDASFNEDTYNSGIEAIGAAIGTYLDSKLPVNNSGIPLFSVTPTYGFEWTASQSTSSSDDVVEFYNKSGATISRNIVLPVGYYRLTCIGLTRTDFNSVLSVSELANMNIATVAKATVDNKAQANSWFNKGYGVNELDFQVTTAKEVNVCLTADNGGSGDHWTVWKNFTLVYLGTSDDAQLNHEIYLDGLAVTDANNAISDNANVLGSEYVALNSAISALESYSGSGTNAEKVSERQALKYAIVAPKNSLIDAAANYNALAAAITNATNQKTNNSGSGAFQYGTSAQDELQDAINVATNAKSDPSTTAATALVAITTLETAVAEVELNAPADGKKYYIKVATAEHAKINNAWLLAAGATGANNPTGYTITANNAHATYLAQAFTFTQVSGNTYNISMTLPEGEVYLTYGSLNGSAADWNTQQIQATTNAENKGEFKIYACNTANTFKIYNTVFKDYIDCQDGGSIYTDNTIEKELFTFAEASQASVEVSIGAGEIATRIFPFTPTLPDGVVAYSCSADDGTRLTLESVATPVANTPYILYSGSGCALTDLEGWGTAKQDSYKDDYLTGVFTRTEVPVNSYVLQKKDDKLGFYRVSATGQYSSAYRVYVTVPSGDVKSFGFTLDDIETAIRAAEAEGQTTVTLRYNAAGQQIQSAQKGLNIIRMSDGSVRKVLVK